MSKKWFGKALNINTIKNNETDILKFINELKTDNSSINIDETAIILDLTGGYETICRDTLYSNGFQNIMLAEGRKVKNFIRSLKHNKAKTDKIDCYMLVEYGKTFIEDFIIHNDLYKPKANHRQQIQEYYMRIQSLKELKTQEKNRFKAPSANQKIKDGIKRHIDLIEQEIGELQDEISILIDSGKSIILDENSTELDKQNRELYIINNFLTNQKGIKTKISQMLIATLPELGKVNRRTIAAITGTAPSIYESGTISKRRFVMGGRPQIKSTLFTCVLSMARYDQKCQETIENMMQKGRTKIQGIVAMMRKFIVVLNAKVRVELKKEMLL